MPVFESSVALNCDAETLFDFLIHPANMEQVTPPDAGVQIVEAPEVLETGCTIQLEVSGFGPKQRVVNEVTRVERPVVFVEEQQTGPLKQFIHEHRIEPRDGGGVTLIDRIEFEPPGGLAGFLVTEDWLRNSFEEGFAHRRQRFAELFGSAES